MESIQVHRLASNTGQSDQADNDRCFPKPSTLSWRWVSPSGLWALLHRHLRECEKGTQIQKRYGSKIRSWFYCLEPKERCVSPSTSRRPRLLENDPCARKTIRALCRALRALVNCGVGDRNAQILHRSRANALDRPSLQLSGCLPHGPSPLDFDSILQDLVYLKRKSIGSLKVVVFRAGLCGSITYMYV